MPSTYKIQKGDTLGKVAARFYGDASRYPLIVAANHIANPDKLALGQVLVIPDLLVAAGNGHSSPPPAPSANSTSPLSERRLAQVHPIVATRGRSLLELAAHAGITLLVTQGLRTWAEQDALYAKGRTIPPLGKKHYVTMARGGESWHNFGLAFDIVVLDAVGKMDWNTAHPGWKRTAELGKSLGLVWGGEFKTLVDYPHFQYTGGLSLKECRSLMSNGLPAVWGKVH